MGVAAGWFRDARLRWNPKTLVLDVATNALDVDCSIVCEKVGVDEAGDVVDVQNSGGGGGWEKTRFLVVTNP